MGHLFEQVTDLTDLAGRLRAWTSFADAQVYDFGGLVLLLGACLDNMRSHGIPGDMDEIGERLTQEQAEMILRLADALKANPAAWRGSQLLDKG